MSDSLSPDPVVTGRVSLGASTYTDRGRWVPAELWEAQARRIAELERERGDLLLELSNVAQAHKRTIDLQRASVPPNDELRRAAQAVIDRWDTPLWKDAPATATYIHALRDALGDVEPEHCQCEIATVEIRDGEIVSTTIKAPGLPDGLHDLFCADPREVRSLPARAAPETNAHHSPGIGNMVGVSRLHERHAQDCACMVTGSSRCTCGGGSNI